MKHWKRCAALVTAAALCMALLAGCARDGEGLSLSVNVGGTPESLDPIYAQTAGDQTILTHLYENLMRVTVEVSGGSTVTKGMAKSVDREANTDGTVTWTFRLRSAKWSDGQSVKARDFVYAWQRLADPANDSPYASLLSTVMGYDQVRQSGDVSLLQVTAKNDSTLVVVLNGEYDWFLTQVCTSPATMPLRADVVEPWDEAMAQARAAVAAAREAGEDLPSAQIAPWWGEDVPSNGPYQWDTYTPDQALTVTAYDKYAGALSGPQALTFRFADTPETAYELYTQKDVDFVWRLPQSLLAEEVQDETHVHTTELGTYTVLFNGGQELFTDPVVRQALGLVIDRNAVAQAAGSGARPAQGLVPPGVPGVEGAEFRMDNALLDNDEESYAQRCAQARELLANAGYDHQAALGDLEYLYADTPVNAAVAQVLADTWRTELGVQVTPRGVPEELLTAALRDGSYVMAGVNLEALGNDAECFLMRWISEDGENVLRYANSAYDTLMSIIASAPEGAARIGCLHDAEALLLEDHALEPLYTRCTAWQLRETLTGVCRDARGWFVFSGVTTRLV